MTQFSGLHITPWFPTQIGLLLWRLFEIASKRLDNHIGQGDVRLQPGGLSLPSALAVLLFVLLSAAISAFTSCSFIGYFRPLFNHSRRRRHLHRPFVTSSPVNFAMLFQNCINTERNRVNAVATNRLLFSYQCETNSIRASLISSSITNPSGSSSGTALS